YSDILLSLLTSSVHAVQSPIFYTFLSRCPPSSTLFPYTTLFRSELRRVDLPRGEHDTVVAGQAVDAGPIDVRSLGVRRAQRDVEDRKSTRLNSSHVKISYAVFCLKKKKITIIRDITREKRT